MANNNPTRAGLECQAVDVHVLLIQLERLVTLAIKPFPDLHQASCDQMQVR